MGDNITFDKATLPLLVPVNIEALIVGKENTTWVDMSLKFDGIPFNDFLSRNLQAEPCTNTTAGLLEPGIHLHWALPDALCHGKAGGTGEPSRFPPIPNRWLVVRVWSPDKNSPAIKFRAWIIESDTVVTDVSSATQWPALEAERPTYIQVGRLFDLAQWPDETAQAKVSITALGYGDPAFAANYTASKGILGFHDCDPDLDDLGNKDLAYFVAGWYDDGDPAQDPLHQTSGREALDTFDTLAEVLGQNRWFYPGFDALAEKVGKVRELERKISEAQDMLKRIKERIAAPPDESSPELAASAHSRQLSAGENALPDLIAGLEADKTALSKEISDLLPALPGRVLCHGAITGINQWTNKDAFYDSGVPRLDDQTFKLVVGNTAVEALAALLQNNLGNELAELLGAFQYDLLSELEQPGGDDILQRKLHERTFSPTVRGIRWDLSQASPQTSQDSPNSSSPPIPGDITDLLEALNTSQREINRLIREKRWLQSELYAMWYKKVLNFPDNKFVDGKIIEESLTKLDQEIRSLSGKISEKIDPLTKAPRGPEWAELQDKIATLLPGYDLLMLEEAPFWRPNDPALLLAGPPFKSSPRHGDDGRFRLDGRLLCRVLGQQITAIKITIPNAVKKDVEFGTSEVNQWFDLLTMSKAASLPNGITELFREFLLITMNANTCRKRSICGVRKERGWVQQTIPGQRKDRQTTVVKLLRRTVARVPEGAYGRDPWTTTVL